MNPAKNERFVEELGKEVEIYDSLKENENFYVDVNATDNKFCSYCTKTYRIK